MPLVILGISSSRTCFFNERRHERAFLQHSATAQGDWMTTEYVSFISELVFNTPTTNTGTLIVMKDNPSGLPEHDDELRIPVIFY